MKLNRKFEIARTAVDSISRHDDEDQASVLAMLDGLTAHIAAERDAHVARKNAKRDAALKDAGIAPSGE